MAADHDLQSLQPLAEGWRLGPLDGRDHRRHDGKVQMINSTSVRVHQQAAAQKNRLEAFVSVEVVED